MPKSSKKAPKRAPEPRKRPQSRTQGRTRRTQAQTKASRANGSRGGRKPAERHLSDFDRLGPAPIGDPLGSIRWIQSLLLIDAERQIRGRANRELSQGLRATALAIARSLPADIIVAAELLIRSDGAELEADAGPQLEVVAFDPTRPPALHCPANARRPSR